MHSTPTSPDAVPALPAGACDCHVHVFMPETFPYAPQRSYTPPAAGVQALRALHARLGVERAVLVQPSCYGTDNAALCAALQALGPVRARGVAVIDASEIPDAELQRLHACGVRGVRLNLHVQSDNDSHQAALACQLTAERIAALGWHLQVHAGPDVLAGLAPTLSRLHVDVVLDHFGGGARSAPLIEELLGRHRHVWVKLSAPYRVSSHPTYDDLREPVQRYLALASDRLLWASDWPHTGGDGRRTGLPTDIEPFRQEDPAGFLAILRTWTADASRLHAVLSRNPQILYGF